MRYRLGANKKSNDDKRKQNTYIVYFDWFSDNESCTSLPVWRVPWISAFSSDFLSRNSAARTCGYHERSWFSRKEHGTNSRVALFPACSPSESSSRRTLTFDRTLSRRRAAEPKQENLSFPITRVRLVNEKRTIVLGWPRPRCSTHGVRRTLGKYSQANVRRHRRVRPQQWFLLIRDARSDAECVRTGRASWKIGFQTASL